MHFLDSITERSEEKHLTRLPSQKADKAHALGEWLKLGVLNAPLVSPNLNGESQLWIQNDQLLNSGVLFEFSSAMRQRQSPPLRLEMYLTRLTSLLPFAWISFTWQSDRWHRLRSDL